MDFNDGLILPDKPRGPEPAMEAAVGQEEEEAIFDPSAVTTSSENGGQVQLDLNAILDSADINLEELMGDPTTMTAEEEEADPSTQMVNPSLATGMMPTQMTFDWGTNELNMNTDEDNVSVDSPVYNHEQNANAGTAAAPEMKSDTLIVRTTDPLKAMRPRLVQKFGQAVALYRFQLYEEIQTDNQTIAGLINSAAHERVKVKAYKPHFFPFGKGKSVTGLQTL